MPDQGKIKRDLFLLLGVVVVVFFGSLVLARAGGPYVSPDETANAFFTTQFAQTGSLRWFEPLNRTFQDMIHPRSIISLNGWLVPGGFIGIPVLYGLALRLFGLWTLPFLTPVLAAAAVFAWYGVVKTVFNRRIALWAGLLLAIHPAWWYYTARSLMPNVPLVSFLVFCLYFLISRPFQRIVSPWMRERSGRRLARFGKTIVPQLDILLAGAMAGIALFIRPSAGPWLFFGALTAVMFFYKRLSAHHVALFIVAVLIALSPMFFMNRATYGDPLAIGYTAQQDTATITAEQTRAPETDAGAIAETSNGASATRAISRVGSLLFPFGIHPRAILQNTFDYGLAQFWWMTVLVLIGLPLVFPGEQLTRDQRRNHLAYVASATVVAIWLVVLYGSWRIHDNPDPNAVTIANSYVRYWIPVFLLSTPMAAFGIDWITSRANTKHAKIFIKIALLAACLALSIRIVFFSPDDGLVRMAENLDRSAEIKSRVLNETEAHAVIVVDRGDKLFFPQRRVLYPLRSERTYAVMPRLERRVPLYYYGITFPEEDMVYLNNKKFAEDGLFIELLATFDEESLYRIESVK